MARRYDLGRWGEEALAGACFQTGVHSFAAPDTGRKKRQKYKERICEWRFRELLLKFPEVYKDPEVVDFHFWRK